MKYNKNVQKIAIVIGKNNSFNIFIFSIRKKILLCTILSRKPSHIIWHGKVFHLNRLLKVFGFVFKQTSQVIWFINFGIIIIVNW